jgi:hypothetical protein
MYGRIRYLCLSTYELSRYNGEMNKQALIEKMPLAVSDVDFEKSGEHFCPGTRFMITSKKFYVVALETLEQFGKNVLAYNINPLTGNRFTVELQIRNPLVEKEINQQYHRAIRLWTKRCQTTTR